MGKSKDYQVEEALRVKDEESIADIDQSIVNTIDHSRYWKDALVVINDWAQYNSAKKLYYNALHKETYHRVKEIIDKYYGGNVSNIARRREELSDNLDIGLSNFLDDCEKEHVEEISRDWLYDHLQNGNDYEKMRKKILRRLGKNRWPVSLKDLI